MTIHTGIRGIRDTLPPGVVIGRMPGTAGPAQTFDLGTLGKAIAAVVPAGTGFGQIGNNLVVANLSGVANTPIGVTLTSLMDAVLGSVQGDLLYRNATQWTVLAPGTSGYFLATQGAAANPLWAAGNTGTVTSVSVTTANGVSGTVANPTTTPAITLSLGAITPSSISTGGQITSTLATGTAPFVIASTTNVANLNASSLGGATFSAPGAIGGGTPGAITGTTITGTDTTDSSSSTTGALITAGGLGVAKAIFAGTTIQGTTITATTALKSLILDSGSAADLLLKRNGTTGITLGASSLATFAGHLVVEGVTSTGATGTGKFVFDNSPVLTTPNIGSATGSISGNAATVTTNANLTGPIASVGNATSIASQTGTGTKLVVDTSPALVTPALGTPASGYLLNCTIETGTWTVAFSGWTNVGTPVISGNTYAKIGKLIYLQAVITPGTTVASTAGSSFLTGMPYVPAAAGTCNWANDSLGTGLGGGVIDTAGTGRLYPPTIAATGNIIVVSACYMIA